MKISIVMPVFNETKTILEIIRRIKLVQIDKEIIIVDDCSVDGTKDILKNLKDKDIKVLFNEKNMGKGAAVRTGMKTAKGLFRIFTDADIPYELDAIGTMLRYLDFKEFQLVIGDRNLKGSSYLTEIPELRKFTSIFFTRYSAYFI